MATQLITAQYGDMPVIFQSDAFINATAIAKQFNKVPKDYLRTESTKEYIKAIGQICLIDENQIVVSKVGSSENGGGTWFHPKLAIDFARWLDVKFAIWCDMQIEKILSNQIPDFLKPVTAPMTFSQVEQHSKQLHRHVDELIKKIPLVGTAEE